MSVVGIDFGNCFCTIAQAKRGGIDIVLNENTKRQTACVRGAARRGRRECSCRVSAPVRVCALGVAGRSAAPRAGLRYGKA
jgi:hypothetical protein